MNRLESFIQALGGAMHCAQQATGLRWPGIRIASMEVVLAATVESGDAPGALALRIGRAPRRNQTLHQLSIAVPGDAREAIVVYLDGQLFGHYGRPGDGQAN
ncbi:MULTISPECIES: hypothetical protein [unclassified Pseudomonas]|uniref:hypothetical protein n=1 Tax=unclassified Pseudomonas TaxID=196821 RepID=UPI0024484BFC|nr:MULTISPECIES: hypothetical protein [unclassified Pseudomonas]MDH0300997.1 hypothetical protein [Pseudomonas sp. GD04091]MDH1983471.1 hypothetical protein [Pseudomonas sp. GD03689]